MSSAESPRVCTTSDESPLLTNKVVKGPRHDHCFFRWNLIILGCDEKLCCYSSWICSKTYLQFKKMKFNFKICINRFFRKSDETNKIIWSLITVIVKLINGNLCIRIRMVLFIPPVFTFVWVTKDLFRVTVKFKFFKHKTFWLSLKNLRHQSYIKFKSLVIQVLCF